MAFTRAFGIWQMQSGKVFTTSFGIPAGIVAFGRGVHGGGLKSSPDMETVMSNKLGPTVVGGFCLFALNFEFIKC